LFFPREKNKRHQKKMKLLTLGPSVSSEYWAVYKKFASQSLHNRNFLKKKFGEAKDCAIFPFFILLHKRAKPIHPPYIHPSAHLSTLKIPSARVEPLAQ